MNKAAGKKAFIFGNNQVGQLGISFGEDFALNPQEISHVEADMIATVAMNQNQTFLVLNNGSLLSSGENDNNELARSGKRSYLHRVDALETFQIQEAATGFGFTTLVCDDGRVVSWGKNDMGQLCNGTRENKEKPRVNTSIQEAILQVASGATHCIALTKTGRVVVWGGNRWGQLGDGQLTSSTKILSPIQLRHRPVISVTCGENHSLVMTTGGNVYSWGENSQGQLGLSDTTSRLRPELVKAFRSMGASKIATGRNHSLVISQGGLLLAFGSNNHGQCGLDSEVKIQPQPTVVERLRELRAVDVCGGFAHTMVLCESRSADSGEDCGQRRSARVYVMGLNSSGQLGLGNMLPQTTPTLLQLDPAVHPPIGIATGALAMHSLVITGPGTNPLRQRALPSVTLEKISETVHAFKDHVRRQSTPSVVLAALVRLREVISAAYASIPVLNASFLLPVDHIGHSSLCVDLKAVRGAYDLIMSTEALDPLAVVTLGRATLHLADQLKECPVDDAENLSVFLIALENPLMLRASSFHVAIELVIRGILSVPKYYRLILFKWLKSYPSEYFGRVLQVLQGFLTHILTNRSLNLDPTPVIMVLETLYQCNCEVKIVPEALFYNPAIPRTVNLCKEWVQFRSPSFDSNVFNYSSYPFLIHEYHKLKLLQFDFKSTQEVQASVFKCANYIVPFIMERIKLLDAAIRMVQARGESTAPAPTTATSPPTVDGTDTRTVPVTTPLQEPPEPSPVPGRPVSVVGVTAAVPDTLLDASAEGGRSRNLPPQQSAPAASASPPAGTAPHGANPAFNIRSVAVDDLIEQAGPELFTRVQSSRPTQLPPGMAVSYEIVNGALVSDYVELWLEIRVSRGRLLPDLIASLDRVLSGDMNVLALPLRVVFEGEVGVDYGGVKREFFTLAVKEIITRTDALVPCSSGQVLWFKHHASTASAGEAARLRGAEGANKQPRREENWFTMRDGQQQTQVPAQRPLVFYLGLLMGLALYNGVHVDIPLPRSIYKTIKGEELALPDLYAVDPELAKGLQALLAFEEGTGSIEDVFGVTFTASANPLISSDGEVGSDTLASVEKGAVLESAYVDLVEGGKERLVTRVNRTDFVARFVRHALYGSAAAEIDLFVKGLRICFHDQALGMCSVQEIEHVLCGSKDIGDLSELRVNTTYRGAYTDESPIIQWFWNMLSSLSLAEKRKFLHFVTGGERVPLGGLSYLRLTIQSTAQQETALPTSHTCFNILNIPQSYSSYEQLAERFHLALQHHEGFGLI